MKIIHTFLLVLLTGIMAFAQNATSKKALEAYNNMFYAEAAHLYQEVVDKTGGSQEELLNLADSYVKLQQYVDAELTFEKLFKTFPSQSQKVILKYAQTLAQNQRYEESLKYYEKYSADERGRNFVEAYNSLNKYFRDSSKVSIGFLPINTIFAEYSPAIYEDGLVFCSNRNTNTGIKRVYGWNETPYSDLYYVLDAKSLKNHWITDNALTAYQERLANRADSPDFTQETSNDNRTVGNFAPEYLGEAKMKEEETVDMSLFNSKINTKYNEGPACFSKNFDTIYFTRNSYFQGKASKDHGSVVRLQLFYATKGPKGKFGNIQPFPFNNPEYSVGHPALTPDGSRLYFVSDKPGGKGETDIYYCEIREHRFTDPVNAGDILNTPGTEMFPSFNKDGSLFFSSDGHPGLGGLDIFRADFVSNQFLAPENLCYPMNSSKDDFGVCANDSRGTRGYLSSNRTRGRADDNIYAYFDNRPQKVFITGVIKMKPGDGAAKSYVEPVEGAVVTLEPAGTKITTDRSGRFEFLVERGKVYSLEGVKENIGKARKDIDLTKPDKKSSYNADLILDLPVVTINYSSRILDDKSKEPLKGATIYLYDMEAAKAEKITADSSGNFMALLQPNHSYLVKSNADGHFSDCYKVYVSPNATGTINAENMELKKIQVNTAFEVKNLLYDYRKSEIRPDAAEVLDKVVRFLKDYPEIVVELGSHTDARGNDEYNQKLSTERAKAAVDYIVSHGIDSSRITAKGYGETQLINRCKNNVECTDEEHQENRRTEIKVTGIVPVATPQTAQNTPVSDPKADPQTVFKTLSDFTDCKVIKIGN